jgi:Holliday junction resolvase RusA-like endonuclease
VKRMLSLEIPGKAVSGNASFRTGKYGSYTSSEAKEYKERIRSIAFSEVLRSRWKAPAYAGVLITAFNSRLDCDNIAKTTIDALQGTAISNDRYNTELLIRKRVDKQGPRLHILVWATAKGGDDFVPGCPPAQAWRKQNETSV